MATKTIKKLKRLAASLIVLRQKNSAIPGDKFEILLVQRSRTMKFATSTWVFPGGVYDKADGDGVEDNVHLTHDQLDRYWIPNRMVNVSDDVPNFFENDINFEYFYQNIKDNGKFASRGAGA